MPFVQMLSMGFSSSKRFVKTFLIVNRQKLSRHFDQEKYSLRGKKKLCICHLDDNNSSVAHVFHENDYERRIFEELKDDKAIVKKAAQNDRYKLVERPKFLMSFESREWEGRYAAKQFRRHFR